MNRKTAKEGRRPLPEWLAVRLDIPPDLVSGGFRVELRGRHALTVHGCIRIGAYTPEEITLAVRGGDVIISGERMVCPSYLAGAVGIDGRIDCIRLTGENGEGRREE